MYEDYFRGLLLGAILGVVAHELVRQTIDRYERRLNWLQDEVSRLRFPPPLEEPEPLAGDAAET